jgi:hypothetical protein
VENQPLRVGQAYAKLNGLPSFSQAQFFASPRMPKTPANHPLAGQESYLQQLPAAWLNAFDVNDRIHHYRIENLPLRSLDNKATRGQGPDRGRHGCAHA